MVGGGLVDVSRGGAGGAEVVEDLGFVVMAAGLAYEGECLAVEVKGFAVSAEPAIDVADSIQGAGLARQVARLAPQAEGHLLVLERVLVAAQVFVDDSEVTENRALVPAVAHQAEGRQRLVVLVDGLGIAAQAP